ncbi:hypothetical protein NECAME_03781 [Necator americanus]|uniref:Uncharacterized protein n=1 Tax=Necator americanus TaxID=51031 RepID=W2T1G2_NECAM|nr:hypothetical protein NECAME_03781 [Necator americanus]ETN75399.1 hypothetical protein NECAME_03781 [Necator americanus]
MVVGVDVANAYTMLEDRLVVRCRVSADFFHNHRSHQAKQIDLSPSSQRNQFVYVSDDWRVGQHLTGH